MKISQQRRSAGFTLVEMLVVIAIISILAGLTTVVAVSVIGIGKDVAIRAESDQLDMAMKAFKQQYGAYPPMNLTCPGSTPNAALQAFVIQAFPRYAGNLYNDLTSLSVDTVNFRPDRALVFWLSGFSSDVTSPFVGGGARTPLYNFDQTRLYNMSTNPPTAGYSVPATGYNSQLGQYAYIPQGCVAPYVYYDSYSYGTINTSSSPGTVTYTYPYPVTNILGSTSETVVPYLLDVQPTVSGGLIIQSTTFCNPTSFQIISAGQDGLFGNASTPPGASGSYKLYPTGWGYDTTGADLDNVTNFSQKATLGASLAN